MTIRNQRFSLLKQPIYSTLNQHLIDYPTPSNLSYWWGFGSLAGICLVIQIVTGVFLAMHHTPHVDLAFNSVEHIMRDVEGGWLLRYMHANGASMFLIVVHLHIFRGLYHASYSSPREFVRCLGVVIFLLMIVTAFIGYVPPWGQMSFWGATVITSLASAIPVVGDTIVTWLWGGFSVDNATLNRFFSLHYLLPLILVGASLLHLAALHQYGSNNPLGVHSEMDKIASYPYFYVKDLVGRVASAIFSSIWIFFAPNVLGHPDNYIPANPMPTPPHIVPEWYFLPIHAILRSIPDKAGGVAAIAPVFISLLALPFFKEMYVRSSSFRPIHQGIFWLLLADCLLLGWIGCQPVEAPFVTIGQIPSFFFFLFFAITPIPGRVGRGIQKYYTDERIKGKGYSLKSQRDEITPYIFLFLTFCLTCVFVETCNPRAAGVVLSNPLLVCGQLACFLFLFYYSSQNSKEKLLSLLVFSFSTITSLYLAGVPPLLLVFFIVTVTVTVTLFPVGISDYSFFSILCLYMLDPHLARWGFFLLLQLWAYQILTCLLKKARPCPIRLTGMLLVGTFLFYTGTLSFGSVQLFFEGRALIKLAALFSGAAIIYICLERQNKWEDSLLPFIIYFFSTLLIAVEATPTNTTKILGVASGIFIFIAIHLSGVMMIFFFKFIEEWGSLKGKQPLVPFYFSFIWYYSNSLPELAPIHRWINGIELLLLLIGVFWILEDQMSNKRGSSSHKNRPKGSRAANKPP